MVTRPLARLRVKGKLQAIEVPPHLFFTPTLENFHEVQERSDYLLYAKNSLIVSVVSTTKRASLRGVLPT